MTKTDYDYTKTDLVGLVFFLVIWMSWVSVVLYGCHSNLKQVIKY